MSSPCLQRCACKPLANITNAAVFQAQRTGAPTSTKRTPCRANATAPRAAAMHRGHGKGNTCQNKTAAVELELRRRRAQRLKGHDVAPFRTAFVATGCWDETISSAASALFHRLLHLTNPELNRLLQLFLITKHFMRESKRIVGIPNLLNRCLLKTTSSKQSGAQPVPAINL